MTVRFAIRSAAAVLASINVSSSSLIIKRIIFSGSSSLSNFAFTLALMMFLNRLKVFMFSPCFQLQPLVQNVIFFFVTDIAQVVPSSLHVGHLLEK
jgi:hypothetical protein